MVSRILDCSRNCESIAETIRSEGAHGHYLAFRSNQRNQARDESSVSRNSISRVGGGLRRIVIIINKVPATHITNQAITIIINIARARFSVLAVVIPQMRYEVWMRAIYSSINDCDNYASAA